MSTLLGLLFGVVLNLALYFPMRRLGRAQVRRAKLRSLEEQARTWQALGYLVPVRFYWEGSNPALLWVRKSDREEFPLVID